MKDRERGRLSMVVCIKSTVDVALLGVDASGMRGSRVVVALNKDPKAPIHLEADYSVVADLYEIVPALIRNLDRFLGRRHD